jgi:hypothetical protein
MEDYVPGEIIVRFDDNVSSKEADMIIKDFGLSVKNTVGLRNLYLIAVPVGSEEKCVEEFKKLTSVSLAQCNGLYGFGALDKL